MKSKAYRTCLLCFLLLALFLLAGASHGQETRSELEERISQLRAEVQNLEAYRAELQHDLRELDDDESGPSQYVVSTTRRPGILDRGMHALIPKEVWANMMALEVLLGNKTPLEVAVRTRHILSETKAFPREARKKIVEIGEELEGIKQELTALEARLARLKGNTPRDTQRAEAYGRDSQRPGPSSSSAPQFTVEDNTWLEGNAAGSYVYTTLPVTNLQECQDACAKAPQRRCQSYQYIKPNGIPEVYGSRPFCLLSESVESVRAKAPNACCIVGIRKQPS